MLLFSVRSLSLFCCVVSVVVWFAFETTTQVAHNASLSCFRKTSAQRNRTSTSTPSSLTQRTNRSTLYHRFGSSDFSKVSCWGSRLSRGNNVEKWVYCREKHFSGVSFAGVAKLNDTSTGSCCTACGSPPTNRDQKVQISKSKLYMKNRLELPALVWSFPPSFRASYASPESFRVSTKPKNAILKFETLYEKCSIRNLWSSFLNRDTAVPKRMVS